MGERREGGGGRGVSIIGPSISSDKATGCYSGVVAFSAFKAHDNYLYLQGKGITVHLSPSYNR